MTIERTYPYCWMMAALSQVPFYHPLLRRNCNRLARLLFGLGLILAWSGGAREGWTATDWLLVLTQEGGVHGVPIDAGTGVTPIRIPDSAAPNAERIVPLDKDGYLLLEQGRLLPLDRAPIAPTPAWPSDNPIVDICGDTQTNGLWLLALNGELFYQQGIEQTAAGIQFPGEPAHGRLNYDPSTNRFLRLQQNGHFTVLEAGAPIYQATLEGAAAAALIPNTSGVAIAHEDGRLFYGDPIQGDLSAAGMVSATPVIDMEILPNNRVFVLDVFGRVHDNLDRPVSGFEPLPFPLARDLAVAEFETAPRWEPPAWRTRLSLSPGNVSVEPIPGGGLAFEESSKPRGGVVELRVSGAQELSGWIAELHYDPSLFSIAGEEIEVGSWWRSQVPSAQVSPFVGNERGVLWLNGGSAAQPGGGANGDGVLAQIRVLSRIDQPVSGQLELVQSSVSHTSLPLLFRQVGEPQSVTVTIRMKPRNLDLEWIESSTPSGGAVTGKQMLNTPPNALVRTAVILEEGPELRRIDISFNYDTRVLEPVVAYPGPAWKGRGPVDIQESVRPGGQYMVTLREVDESAASFGGEILTVIWRFLAGSVSNESQSALAIQQAKAFATQSAAGTLLRIDRESLEIGAARLP